MRRSTILLLGWLALPAFAGSAASNEKAANKVEEGKLLADSFISGNPSMSIGNACSRLKFIGQETVAARMWAGALLSEGPVERRRLLAEGLAILANPQG